MGKKSEDMQSATDLGVYAPTVIVVDVDAQAIVTKREGKGRKKGSQLKAIER